MWYYLAVRDVVLGTACVFLAINDCVGLAFMLILILLFNVPERSTEKITNNEEPAQRENTEENNS